MQLDRRAFFELAAAAAITSPAVRAARSAPRYRAVAFDAFPILDARPIGGLAERLFPGRGQALTDLWRIRQFEYQWLRALSGQYADFWRATMTRSRSRRLHECRGHSCGNGTTGAAA